MDFNKNGPAYASLEVEFAEMTYRVSVSADSVYGTEMQETAVALAQRAMHGFIAAAGLEDYA